MENDRGLKKYEQETNQERKRKAAYLESLLESTAKKPSRERANNSQEGLDKGTSKYNGGVSDSDCGSPENTAVAKNSMGNGNSFGGSLHRKESSPSESNSTQQRTLTNHPNPEATKPRENGANNHINHYTSFQSVVREGERSHSPGNEHSGKRSEFTNTVTVKQEQKNDSLPVQIVSVESHHKQQSGDENDIGDEYQKFLLFAGKLYLCERFSDIPINFSRYTMESLQGRKGKVVVLLLFHKLHREVVSYVVGVVDYATLEEHTIIIKIIKSHIYPAIYASGNDAESKLSQLLVGSKKVLYNLQHLQGSIYHELVRILDGFGANSAVDHSKITEFNAMINANSDRSDAHFANFLSNLSNNSSKKSSTIGSPLTRSFSVRASQNNMRSTSVTIRPAVDNRYSPVKSNESTISSASERSNGTRPEVENGYPKMTSQGRVLRYDLPGNIISSNPTAGLITRTYSNTSAAEQYRAAAAAGIPLPPTIRFHSTVDEGATAVQRRNVEGKDLQTVAELYKEKMKRDMAEQELKTIKAAFEEFKSQMQRHLSQVEERMVLLEAENRNLKGKLSTIHQSNGFAEKKYHDLKTQLEELLKST